LLKTVKIWRWVLGVGVFFAMARPSFSQDITSISLPSSSIVQNTEITFKVELQKQGLLTWCGLQFNFGNGESRTVRVGDNGDEDLNTLITYRYPNPGIYTAFVEGKLLIRGIKSVIPCGGERQQLIVTVVDLETKRLREELLLIEADKQERQEKDQKARESERQKAADLAQKEEILKKREQELRRQEELKKVEPKKIEAPRLPELKKEEPPKPKAKVESIL
jgi:hypothetical protein